MSAFFQGLLLGLAYAAPIGAQNVYVIKSALHYPLRYALRVALAVALADIVLGLACFWGIGALLTASRWLAYAIELIGALFLIYLGSKLWRERPPPTVLDKEAGTAMRWRQIASAAIVLTWFNPQALVDGSLILGGFRAQLPATGFLAFMLGMAAASLLWFPAIVLVLGLFRSAFNPRTMRWVNRLCGLLLAVLGLKLLVQLFG